MLGQEQPWWRQWWCLGVPTLPRDFSCPFLGCSGMDVGKRSRSVRRWRDWKGTKEEKGQEIKKQDT